MTQVRYTHEVLFTKVFVKGSTLEGLTYDDSIKVAGMGEAIRTIKWCKAHAETPVKACAGSDYTIIYRGWKNI